MVWLTVFFCHCLLENELISKHQPKKWEYSLGSSSKNQIFYGNFSKVMQCIFCLLVFDLMWHNQQQQHVTKPKSNRLMFFVSIFCFFNFPSPKTTSMIFLVNYGNILVYLFISGSIRNIPMITTFSVVVVVCFDLMFFFENH